MSDGKITFKVATSKGVFEGTFDVSDKVHDVIVVIVKDQGLVEGDAFELAWDGTPLGPDRQIGSFGLEDGAVLDLVASGSGV